MGFIKQGVRRLTSYFLIGILLAGSSMLTSCGQKAEPIPDEQNVDSLSNKRPNQQEKATSVDVNMKAIYLVLKRGGVIRADELINYPQVAVVNTFDELKKLAVNKVGIWIDKDAASMVEAGWFQKEPQKYYPVVLVGCSDDVYSFREMLPGFGIDKNLKIATSIGKFEPGFSVWKLKKETATAKSAFMRGYPIQPGVNKMLEITNDLLQDILPDYIRIFKEQSQQTEFKPASREEGLTAIEYHNLNNMSNPIVSMKLKDGWTAEKYTWKKPDDFEFNDYKNKFVTETYEYNLFNEKKEQIGEFGLRGWYHNNDGSSFPNHRQSTIVRYKGSTKIGNGTIYLLKLDLPREQVAKEKDYFLEYYALIPIKNEHLAYNFILKVPENQNPEETLSAMKKILGADINIEGKIHELFINRNTRAENKNKVIALLASINWNTYFKAYGNEGLDLMDWLSDQKVSVDELITILSSTYGLDGAYTESYCHLVSTLYVKDRLVFIKALSRIEPDQVEPIISYVAYDLTKDKARNEKEELEKLVDMEGFFPREKDMIMLMIDVLSKK